MSVSVARIYDVDECRNRWDKECSMLLEMALLEYFSDWMLFVVEMFAHLVGGDIRSVREVSHRRMKVVRMKRKYRREICLHFQI